MLANSTVNLVDENDDIIGGSTPLPVRKRWLATNVQVDSVDENISYVGKAELGSLITSDVWQIRKIDCTTGTIITWADSDASYDNIFNNRESLTYG
jgi:hypothetical protein